MGEVPLLGMSEYIKVIQSVNIAKAILYNEVEVLIGEQEVEISQTTQNILDTVQKMLEDLSDSLDDDFYEFTSEVIDVDLLPDALEPAND